MPPITFQDVPASARVPKVFVEIDPSLAGVGPAIQEYRTLLAGQRTSAGTIAEGIPYLATSADEVAQKSGAGSIAHGMAIAYFRQNRFTETWVVGIDDDGGGTRATQTITVSGTATANGTIFLYIAGRRITVGIVSGDTENTIAAAIDAAIAASDFATELPVTSGVATRVVTLTARNAGTLGNEVDVRLNHQQGEALPAGFTVTIAAGVAGATDPSASVAVDAMADVQYHTIASGLNDTTAIGLWNTELAARFGPVEQLDGHAFVAVDDTFANLITLGSGLNGRHTSVLGLSNALTPTWERAAAVVGIVAREGQADPARPFTTLELLGVTGNDPADRFTYSERELLLRNGIATIVTDELGVVRVERLITTSQTNEVGANSTAFLDVNTLLTLSFLRYDLRTQYASTFPRAKLADDGTRFGAGQVVVTPKIVEGFVLSLFRSWEERGLVEGFSQFQADLLVERSLTDPNRLDVRLSPDLVNQLLVTGVSIRYLL